jgi:hypothetical protein
VTANLLYFRDIADPDKSKWPQNKTGTFIQIGGHACHVALFKKYWSQLKELFHVKDTYREEARQR